VPNYGKKIVVKPGSKIRLKHFDPGYHGKHKSHKSALPEIQENVQKMDELQYLMYAENKHSLLIVFQGLDAAGKDGTVRHVFTGMNPEGCICANFKQRLSRNFQSLPLRRCAGGEGPWPGAGKSLVKTLRSN